MDNPLVRILKDRREKNIKGLYCACTANEFVISTCMKKALATKTPLIVEATANQVNQYGGYTGMKPQDYMAFIAAIATKNDFPLSELILGGDHLGPLTWCHLPQEEAMAEAKELVRLYALAGFTKLHLDTSMRLADDDPQAPLPTAVIARRGAELAAVAETAYQSRLVDNPEAIPPCYIIGSEVPIPGGEQEDTGVKVTSATDFSETVRLYQTLFAEYGLTEAFSRVIAVVVQPGVEFGEETIHEYQPEQVVDLLGALAQYPNLVFEGHSTDYQTPNKLRAMVDDNVALLKVGPGLTFAYRQGLFALASIEQELFAGVKPLSDLVATIERVMLEQPKDWQKYYHGDAKKLELARKYAYSDRVRYYLPDVRIQASIEKLFANFMGIKIPWTLLLQFMPKQYDKVREHTLDNEAKALVEDFVGNCIDDYLYAIVR